MTSPVLLSDMQTVVQIDDRFLHEMFEIVFYEQASDGVWVRSSEVDRYEGLLVERERSRLDDAEVEELRERRHAG